VPTTTEPPSQIPTAALMAIIPLPVFSYVWIPAAIPAIQSCQNLGLDKNANLLFLLVILFELVMVALIFEFDYSKIQSRR
jgi:hypothetical protein